MPTADERKFSFESKALNKDDLEVVSFEGVEALSELFSFDVVLVSRKTSLDLDAVVGARASLTLSASQGGRTIHGLAASFELTGKVDDFAFYRARLVPTLHPLTLTENCRVFLDKSLPDIIREVFTGHGLAQGSDYELRLTGDYPSWPYVSQFRESDFAFVSRWMERDGLFYFFEQGQDGTRMVIADHSSVHQPLPGKSEFRYETPSGLVEPQGEEGIFSFSRRLSPLPRSVMLKDFNPETPSLDLSAEARVLENGRGDMRLYGEHFRTVEEGRKLAEVRAQELQCRRSVASGESSHPGMAPGWLMKLDRHFKDAANRKYLLTRVRHRGRQYGFLTAGLGFPHSPDGEPETYYRNEFTAIPSDVQFRPPRLTPWPRLEGLMNAVIDGAGSGKYAEVDDQGRYKMITVYDRSGRADGNASHWVRMAQPYAGDGHGMHFPLHKGCEAVFACLDGDPDRPVLLGAVPNPENQSVVTSANQTKTVLQSAGNNHIHFEDKQGSERVLLHSQANQSFMRIGSPNDPPAFTTGAATKESQSGFVINTPGDYSILCGSSLQTFLISYTETYLIVQSTNLITKTGLNVGFIQALCGHKFHATGSATEFASIKTALHATNQEITASKTRLVDELIRVRGLVTNLDADVQRINQEFAQLTAECDQLAQEVTQMAQQKVILSGEVNSLAQEKIGLCQSNTELAGQVQQMAQDKIDLATEVTALDGEVNVLSQQATLLATQRTELFSNITETCGEIMNLADLDLTI